MIENLLRSAMATFVRVLDVHHLRWVVRAIYHRLPAPLRLRLSRLQFRVGYMQGLIQVPTEELQRSYEKTLGMTSQGRTVTYREFGVFVGTSLTCMFRAAENVGTPVRMIGFDSPPRLSG